MDEPESISKTAGSYEGHSRASLVHAIGQLHGVSNAALRQIFAMVAELHGREAFYEDGAKDAASWLEMKLGLSYKTAAVWAEIALALESLPQLASAFADGTISLDKLAACVPFATAETDAYLAEEARTSSAAQLERAARRHRTITTDTETEARRRRGLGWTWVDKGASLSIWGRLTAEQGAVFTKSIERVTDAIPFEDEDGPTSRYQRRADALVQLAGATIANDQDPDRATVIAHVPLETLTSGMGVGETEDGAVFSSDVMRRLVCDSRIQLLVEDADGKPLGYGRTMRTAPPQLRRVLMERDRVCCWPGCGRTDFLQSHHRDHWIDGGKTDADVLDMYCPVHHTFIHQADVRIEGDSGNLRFYMPNGREIVSGLSPLAPETRDRLNASVFGPLVPIAVRGPESLAEVGGRPP